MLLLLPVFSPCLQRTASCHGHVSSLQPNLQPQPPLICSSGVTQIKGLTVAFLDARPRTAGGSEDLDALKQRLMTLEGDVDFLLTNEWPLGVTRGLPAGAVPAGASPRCWQPPFVPAATTSCAVELR